MEKKTKKNKNKNRNEPVGDRTPISRMTGEDTSHYTTDPMIKVLDTTRHSFRYFLILSLTHATCMLPSRNPLQAALECFHSQQSL